MRDFRIAVRGRALMRIPLGEVPSRFPYVLLVPQATTEAELYARLAELGHTPLSGHRVTGARQDGPAWPTSCPAGTACCSWPRCPAAGGV
ncbi:hypothetical protein [Nonomuraea sp. KM88]|uniref:hypothetical protein n=1 Tax=Nonomuraea sp. KM88 TaxID=3457427 RepID=UPI003FCC9DF8